MPRKILTFLSFSLFSIGIVFSSPLSPEEALKRISNIDLSIGTRSVAGTTPVVTVVTRIGEPALYIFNNFNSKGFNIVSADDAVTPLLGFSDSDNFDADNIPPAMQEWLDGYAAQIAYIRENLPMANATTDMGVSLPQWSAINPLVKTIWGQGEPFNNLCPLTVTNQKTVTGCVATSMAQVMNYFKYPEKGQGSIAYTSNGQTLKLDFNNTIFDWNNMINSYTGAFSEAQADAVAKLMQAAGYSVQMAYSADFSGALSGLIPGALINYFNYDKGLRYEKRTMYTYTDWATKIYDNLKNIGPVIYDGNSISGSGHSFVCDGFQDGYFHFNWGWNGISDGYFLLDALNPSALGTGGGDGGYNFTQNALFGIQKPTGQSVDEQDDLVLYGSITGFINDANDLSMNVTGGGAYNGWSYNGTSSIVMSIGISIVPADDSSATPVYKLSTNKYNLDLTLKPGQYLPNETTDQSGNPVSLRPTFPLSQLGLTQNVKYKVTNVGLDTESNQWLPFRCDVGSYNYFYITKTGSGNSAGDYKIETWQQPMQFSCGSLQLSSDLYNGIAVDAKATLTNNNDIQLTRGLTLILINTSGGVQYKGDTSLITLSPGETASFDWTTLLTSQTGVAISKKTEFYPALYDPTTGIIYYKSPTTVSMDPFPGVPSFQCTISVDNAEFSDNKYYVADSSDFNVSSKINVTRNIFSYPVTLWVAEQSNQAYTKLLSFPYEITVIESGESATFNSNVDFPDAEIGKTYYLLCYINKKAHGTVGFVAQGNGAGIKNLESCCNEIVFIHNKAMDSMVVTGGESGIASVEVYAINGIKLTPKVSHFTDGIDIDLSSMGKGIVVVRAIDGKGNSKSQKITL